MTDEIPHATWLSDAKRAWGQYRVMRLGTRLYRLRPTEAPPEGARVYVPGERVTLVLIPGSDHTYTREVYDGHGLLLPAFWSIPLWTSLGESDA